MKKLFMFTLIPLILSMIAVPAIAKPIGPQKAVDKNPHIMATPEGVEILLPTGGIHSWTINTSASCFDFMNGLNASKPKIPNAYNLTMTDLMEMMTNETAALEAENKWGHMSQEVLIDMFIFELMEADPTLTYEEAKEIATPMAAGWPDGIYIKFVNVGTDNQKNNSHSSGGKNK